MREGDSIKSKKQFFLPTLDLKKAAAMLVDRVFE
jgi:hypothetical protein